MDQGSVLPRATRWAVGGVVATYIFLHFQDQIRYSRQTIDELMGARNTRIAVWRYGWAMCAAIWALVAGSGYGTRGTLFGLVLIGAILLTVSTIEERNRIGLACKDEKPHWAALLATLVAGIALSAYATRGSYYLALGSAICGALAITVFALWIPTLRAWRDVRKTTTAAKQQRIAPGS